MYFHEPGRRSQLLFRLARGIRFRLRLFACKTSHISTSCMYTPLAFYNFFTKIFRTICYYIDFPNYISHVGVYIYLFFTVNSHVPPIVHSERLTLFLTQLILKSGAEKMRFQHVNLTNVLGLHTKIENLR